MQANQFADDQSMAAGTHARPQIIMDVLVEMLGECSMRINRKKQR